MKVTQRTLSSSRQLFLALFVSLLLHASGLFYFYTHPILLHSSWKSWFGLSARIPSLLAQGDEEMAIEEQTKTAAIEDAFEHFLVLSSHLKHPMDLVKLPEGTSLSPTEETALAPKEIQTTPELTLSQEPSDLSSDLSPLPVDLENSLDLSQLPPQEQKPSIPSMLHVASEPDLPYPALEDPSLQEEGTSPYTFAEAVKEPSSADPSLAWTSPKSIELKLDSAPLLDFPPAASFPEIPSLDEGLLSSSDLPSVPERARETLLSAIPPSSLTDYSLAPLAIASNWNDNFKLQLRFTPDKESEGYLFSLELSPTFDTSDYHLPQHFHFLLDRSHTVQKHRFSVFKRATLKALSCMQPGDSFNIYLLDKKVTSMGKAPIPYSAKAVQAADEFLSKEAGPKFFTSSDLFSALRSLQETLVDTQGEHTAILLTDGHTKFSSTKLKKLLKTWNASNLGNLSVYAAAVGSKNDLLTLDLFSTLNGGKLLYCDTYASFPRKLGKLILDLREPIATHLILSVLPSDPAAKITLSPATSHPPALYARQPYLIVGKTDRLCDFDIVVQGKHKEEWVCIKQSVSFAEGEKSSKALEKYRYSPETEELYAQFLNDGNGTHLQKAKELLKKSYGEIAFE